MSRTGRSDIEYWMGEVAVIRLAFPPEHRNRAQQLAALLGVCVGAEIRRLQPDHTLLDILALAGGDEGAIELAARLRRREGLREKKAPPSTLRNLVLGATSRQAQADLVEIAMHAAEQTEEDPEGSLLSRFEDSFR